MEYFYDKACINSSCSAAVPFKFKSRTSLSDPIPPEMLTVESPLAGNQIRRPKSGRRPLQPRNSLVDTINNRHGKPKPKPKLKPERTKLWMVDDSNKENHPFIKMEAFDASLAEELSAIRQKLDRLRMDKENTEKMLQERDSMLETNMRELEKRDEQQKKLENEVDRLYRLKQLQSSCMRISPIRSLRQKEQKGKIKEGPSQDWRGKDDDESKDASIVQSSNSKIDIDD